jgi:hypothetical protein
MCVCVRLDTPVQRPLGSEDARSARRSSTPAMTAATRARESADDTTAESYALKSPDAAREAAAASARCRRRLVLAWCLLSRLANALLTGESAFNPDEHWQSTEVAYALVWRYARATHAESAHRRTAINARLARVDA